VLACLAGGIYCLATYGRSYFVNPATISSLLDSTKTNAGVTASGNGPSTWDGTPRFPPALATPSPTSGKRTYRVPPERTAEFRRDEKAISDAEAKLDSFNSLFDEYDKALEIDRANLNHNSRTAVKKFNAKVDEMKAMKAQGQKLQDAYNALVKAYNAKLEPYGN
jgi:hypothetical protein